MKKIQLIVAFLLLVNTIFAASISEKNAAQVAKNFVVENASPDFVESFNFFLLDAQVVDNQPLYYIFGNDKKGFVIVSGSSLTTPILGYSFDFPYQENPALNYFLNRYKNEILEMEKNQLCAPAAEKWGHYLTPNFSPAKSVDTIVQPLLTTLWNQTKYYNTYCPWDARAGLMYDYRVPNGCVALAMAMIMNYYQYPTSGTGNIAYTSEYGQLLVRLGLQNYNYNAMADELSGYAGEVSKLVYHCGIATRMRYDYAGSGTTEKNALDIMRDNFNYNITAYAAGPGMFDDWGAELRVQLNKRYPLLYTGNNGAGGHAFVIDGYDNHDLFHVNWGWGGAANGYFQIDRLAPYGGQQGYNIGENALFNLYPRLNYPAQPIDYQRNTASFGYITNNTANQPYQPNLEQKWMVAVPDAISYIFRFSRLDTEQDHDVITIYNGPNVEDGVAGTFSGNELPMQAIEVYDVDSVLITFTTNEQNEGRGFVINYMTLLPDAHCSAFTTLTDESGTITDGSDDNNYRPQTTCEWIVKSPTSRAYAIEFPQFDLKSGDFVDIFNNTTQPATFYKRFDIENMPDGAFACPFAEMKVRFVADNWNNGGGFTLNYSGNNGICDGANSITNLHISPNPAVNFLNVRGDISNNSAITCNIFDMTGKLLVTETFQTDGTQFNENILLPNLAQGMYLLQIENENGKSLQKFLVQ